jgi:hypothetical protein
MIHTPNLRFNNRKHANHKSLFLNDHDCMLCKQRAPKHLPYIIYLHSFSSFSWCPTSVVISVRLDNSSSILTEPISSSESTHCLSAMIKIMRTINGLNIEYYITAVSSENTPAYNLWIILTAAWQCLPKKTRQREFINRPFLFLLGIFCDITNKFVAISKFYWRQRNKRNVIATLPTTSSVNWTSQGHGGI